MGGGGGCYAIKPPPRRETPPSSQIPKFFLMGTFGQRGGFSLGEGVLRHDIAINPPPRRETPPPIKICIFLNKLMRVSGLQSAFCIRSLKCPKKRGPECLVCTVANLDAVLSGNDISKIIFYQSTLRCYLV